MFIPNMKQMKIKGINISSDQLPSLLDELDLLPLFARRLIERTNSANIQPSEEEQYNNLQLFMKNEKINAQEDLNNWLTKNQIDEKTLSLKLFRYLQIEKFKETKFGPKVENIFLSHKEDLDKVMYSIFRSKEKAKAVEIHLKIEEQESTFADLASEYSEGVERQINGLIGPIEIGKINIQIAERLKISQKGQLWEPFKVDDWWVLLRLEKYLPSRLDNSMKKKIINNLYNEWIEIEVDNAINSFKINCEEEKKNSVHTSEVNNSDLNQSNKTNISQKNQLLPDSSRLKSFIKKLPFKRG